MSAIDLGEDLTDGLMGDFLDESNGLIALLCEKLAHLDQWAKNNPEPNAAPPLALLNEMFRAAHSIKGLSGMLRLNDINVLTHKVENIFDAARNGEMPIGTRTVDTVLQAVDCLAAMLDALRSADSSGIDSSPIVAQLERVLYEHGVAREMSTQQNAEQQLAALMNAAEECVAQELKTDISDEPSALTPTNSIADVSDDTDIPSKYLGIFIDESGLTLEELSELLLAPFNPASVEALLVGCHRIKGSAASIGLQRVARLAHVMEDLLQELRRNSQMPSTAQADAMLTCVDALRAFVANVKAGTNGPDGLNEAYTAMVRLPFVGLAAEKPISSPVSQAATPGGSIWQIEVSKLAPRDCEGYVGRIEFEPRLPLVEFKARLLIEKLRQLGKLFSLQPSEIELESASQIESLTFGLECNRPLTELQNGMTIEGVVAVTIAPLQERTEPQTVNPTDQVKTTNKSVDAENPREDKPVTNDVKSKPTETLRVDIERLDQLMSLAGQLVINRARFGQIGERLKGLSSVRMLAHSLAGAQSSAVRLTASLQSAEGSGPIVVDDALVSLAAKLQDDLEAIGRDVSQLAHLRTVLTDLSEAVHQLDRVSDGIQSTVMDTRMVPVGPLFARFKRAIRDLTRENKKDIRLEIGGETTELDKRMIDELGDPLIHLVRNSVDHGIESADAREAAGKPRQGTINLNAYHRGNRIVIEVSDDGRGLDAKRIREKAITKGMITEADADKMSLKQIHDLIWRPGFSTAEKITEVSGRGMGMDIVWSKIESLSGTVELTSEPGKGTTFSIQLPLTLAIMPSLLAVIDGDVFAVPVETVIEIVRVQATELTTVHGQQAIRVRGRVISLVELKQVFDWNTSAKAGDATKSDSVTVVIVGNPTREVGILVDSLVGEQDIVIKSLAENFENIEGIAGASILGDGRVSLIIDVGTLLEMVCRPVGPSISANVSSLVLSPA